MSLAGMGCGGGFQWTGKWSGKRDLPLPSGGDPAILETIKKVDLEITSNGRFELFEGGVPKSGTFRTADGKGFLKVTHFMERPIEDQGEAALKMNEEVELTPQKDGSILFRDPMGFEKKEIRLERQKE